MSDELRKLHRKQTQFTNFPDSRTPELSESTKQNVEDITTPPLRRRRRRRQDNSESLSQNIENISSSSTRRKRKRRSDIEENASLNIEPVNLLLDRYPDQSQIESLHENTKQDPNNISSQSKLNISVSTPNEENINSIRAEILEDRHHSDLIESEYSNDTHDWGQDSYDYSEEYSHFLGRYE